MTEKARFEDVIKIDWANENAKREASELAELCNRHEGLKQLLELKPPAESFGYYLGGELVGYFELVSVGGLEMEGSGMVHPQYRRKGVGRALIEAVQADCLDRDRASFFVCRQCRRECTGTLCFGDRCRVPHVGTSAGIGLLAAFCAAGRLVVHTRGKPG